MVAPALRGNVEWHSGIHRPKGGATNAGPKWGSASGFKLAGSNTGSTASTTATTNIGSSRQFVGYKSWKFGAFQ